MRARPGVNHALLPAPPPHSVLCSNLRLHAHAHTPHQLPPTSHAPKASPAHSATRRHTNAPRAKSVEHTLSSSPAPPRAPRTPKSPPAMRHLSNPASHTRQASISPPASLVPDRRRLRPEALVSGDARLRALRPADVSGRVLQLAVGVGIEGLARVGDAARRRHAIVLDQLESGHVERLAEVRRVVPAGQVAGVPRLGTRLLLTGAAVARL